MASLVGAFQRLGASIRSRSDKKTARPAGRLPARRLRQLEELEQRALLSISAWEPPVVTGMPTGLKLPTQEQLAWERDNMIVTQQVRLNELGLQRINAQRAADGLAPLDTETVPLGQENVGITQAQMDAAGLRPGFSGGSNPGLPAAVDNSLTKYFPPIRSQGGLGSCGSFSSTYYVATYMTAMARNWDVTNNADDTNKFSPKWTYNMINGGGDNGSWPTDAYSVMISNGAATWAEFPYVGSGADPKNYLEWVYNRPEVWEHALDYRLDQTGRITGMNTDAGLASLKTLLADGYLLNYCTNISDWQFTRIGDDTSTPDDDPFVGQSVASWLQSGSGGFHAMTVVGYNDNLWVDVNGNGNLDAGEKGALKIANSWGPGWGNSGFAWLSYDALRDVSAVSGGPSTNREAAWWSNEATWVTARTSYTPAVMARFTINHAQRNQLRMSLGIAEGGSTPVTTWNPSALYDRGGAFGFDGVAYTSNPSAAPDGTFVFDFSDLNTNLETVATYFVGLNDTGDATLPGTLKSFQLLDDTGFAVSTCPTGTSAGNVPQTDADGVSSVAYAFMTFSANHAPGLNTAISTQLGAIDEDAVENPGTRIRDLIPNVAPTDMITDVDANAKEGIAILGARSSLGAWQFSTDGGTTWKALGSVSDASARLLAADANTRLRFVPVQDYCGIIEQAITFRAWDCTRGVNGGTGDARNNGGYWAFSTAFSSASITINAVNDAPVLDSAASASFPAIDEDAVDNPGILVSEMIDGSGVARMSDPDPNALQGIAVTDVNNANGTWQYLLDGGTAWTAFGSPSSTAGRLLDAGARVRFVPEPDFNGTVEEGITFYGWDQSSGTSGGVGDVGMLPFFGGSAFSETAATASITVNPVNDAPVLNAGAAMVLDPIFEKADPATIAGTSVTKILASGGDRITDVDAGALEGMAVVGADQAGGTWQYSLNEGATWSPLGAVGAASARLLSSSPSTKIRFVPNSSFTGQAGITFRAWDQTEGANGGLIGLDALGTACSTATAAATIMVNAVNHAPSFTKGPDVEAKQDAGAQSRAGWATKIVAGPASESGQAVHFEVTGNSNAALFAVQPAVSAAGELTFTPAADATGLALVSVRLVDNGGTANGGHNASEPQTFTITVLPVNHAPSFSAGPDVRIVENAGRQTFEHWASDFSPGPASEARQQWTFAAVPDDASLFSAGPAISPDGTLTFTPARNANGTTLVTVTMTDDGGTENDGRDTSEPQTFEIKISPINAKPSAIAQQLDTDIGAALSIGLTGDDGDPGVSQALRYSIVTGPSHGKLTGFNAQTGAVTYTPDADYFGSDAFTFQVTDDGRAGAPGSLTSDPASVAILVSPVVHAPTTGSGDNLLLVRRKGNNLQVVNQRTNKALFSGALSRVSHLTIEGAAGRADHLVVDFSGGRFQLAKGLVFDGGAGSRSDTITLRGSSSADAFSVGMGGAEHLSANQVPIEIRSVEQVTLEGRGGNDRYGIAALSVPVTVVDSGGTDELDFSEAGAAVTIDLSQSRGGQQTVMENQAPLILNGTIENVTGSPYDDILRGNSAVNRIHGGAGHDLIYGGAGSDRLYGDEGDDWIYGETGHKVLVGGKGSDHLFGGSLGSVLIGGEGSDELIGSKTEDILIGGTTVYDSNDAALAAILKEWSRTRKAFSARVKSLSDGIAGGTIRLARNATVSDDLLADRLTGGGKTDWLFAFAFDLATPKKSRAV